MLGEKPGERHDAELRLKDTREDAPPEAAPGGGREKYLDSPRAARRTSGARFRSGTGLSAIHLTIRYSQAIPISAYPGPGEYDHRSRRWFRSSSDKRSDFTKNQRPVCAAETKRVRHRHINFHFSGVICHIIQVTKGILVEDVDGRR